MTCIIRSPGGAASISCFEVVTLSYPSILPTRTLPIDYNVLTMAIAHCDINSTVYEYIGGMATFMRQDLELSGRKACRKAKVHMYDSNPGACFAEMEGGGGTIGDPKKGEVQAAARHHARHRGAPRLSIS